MDSSAEVSRGDYTKEKIFVNSMASYLRLSPGATRAAVLTYGFTATLVADYDSYDELTTFKNAVQRASYISGKSLLADYGHNVSYFSKGQSLKKLRHDILSHFFDDLNYG